MTVSELIDALAYLPPEAKVEIDASFGDGNKHTDLGFLPTSVEALKNEVTGVSVVIWATAKEQP